MKHTPGPWRIGIYRKDATRPPTPEEMKEILCETIDRTLEHPGSIPDFYLVLSSDDPKDPIHTALVGNGPTSEANALLIAAAPDLLAALTDALLVMTSQKTTLEEHADAITKARIAINKAEGKS